MKPKLLSEEELARIKTIDADDIERTQNNLPLVYLQRHALLQHIEAMRGESLRLREALRLWVKSDEAQIEAQAFLEDSNNSGFSNDPTGSLHVTERFTRANDLYALAVEAREAALKEKGEEK